MKPTNHRPPLLPFHLPVRRSLGEGGSLITFSLVCSVALLFFAAGARGQSSAFTFQGRLNDSGAPANGNYDIQLKLFDTAAPGTGTQIGSTITLLAIPVTNGVFTVQPDFTANAFPGADRFVEVGVKPAASANPFGILTPRQPITPTPYALHSADAITATSATNATNATNAANATNATSATTATNATQLGGIVATNYVQTSDSRLADSRPPTPGSANYIQNTTSAQTGNFNISGNGTVGGILTANGRIGIGTISPLRSLQVGPSPDALFTLEPMDASPNAGYIRFGDNTGWKLHFGRSREKAQLAGGTPNTGTTGILMTIQDNGNVGVGTTAPLAKLDVRGDVKLGSTGQFFAPAGEENLRIIRGTVDAAGHIDAGSGFTVSISNGSPQYNIHFTTPFSDVPTVTGNCDTASAQGCFVMTAATNGGATIWAAPASGATIVSAKFHFIAIGPR